MERFEGAFQMTYGSRKKNKKLYVLDKNMKKPTKKDLVYIDDSPDYCERNLTSVSIPKSNSRHTQWIPKSYPSQTHVIPKAHPGHTQVKLKAYPRNTQVTN